MQREIASVMPKLLSLLQVADLLLHPLLAEFLPDPLACLFASVDHRADKQAPTAEKQRQSEQDSQCDQQGTGSNRVRCGVQHGTDSNPRRHKKQDSFGRDDQTCQSRSTPYCSCVQMLANGIGTRH
jgi:hypothetical protein